MAYILSFFLIFYIYFQCFSSIPLQFSFFEPVPCAKYSCIEKKESCAQSKIIEGKIEVTLSPICKENEKCDVGGDPNTIFYEGKEITGECKPSIIGGTRYPGEDCSKDEDCFNTPENPGFSKCDISTQKCTGISIYEKCSATENCLAGLYCSTVSHRCEPQKSEYQECISSFECENKLLCYQNKCQDILYKLPIGTDINDKETEKGIPLELFCEYGQIVTGHCTAFGYENPEYNEKEAIVECFRGDLCRYNYYPLYLGTMSLPCGCGYNEIGKGYCPIPHSVRNEQWNKLIKIKRLYVDNDCHTKSRFNCYKIDKEFQRVYRHAKDDLEQLNVYYESVQCALKVFDDTN